jgi:glucan phosphorylase
MPKIKPMSTRATRPEPRDDFDAAGVYQRHLAFDHLADRESAGDRERYEALAHAVRARLTPAWLRTIRERAGTNPKRVYYLSMEFLIGGRSRTTS